MAKKKTTSIKKSLVTVTGSNSTKVVDVIKVYGKKNTINARKGNDQITVFKGDGHKINGGAGKDTITVKKGNSHKINGDAGNDKITLAAGKKTVIHGGSGNDTIIVTGGSNNTIYGDKGKDTFVFGKKAKATIKDYTAGQDKLQVSGGIITGTKLSKKNVIFTSGKSSVTLEKASDKKISIKDTRGSYTVSKTEIKLGKDFSGAMDAGKFLSTVTTIDGRAAVKPVNITGNAKDNTIYAAKAGGTINGGTGNDRLEGGAGDDVLTGGSGRDIFVYTSGHDIITDYNPDEDTILTPGKKITAESVDGKDVVLSVGSGNIRLKNAVGKYKFSGGKSGGGTSGDAGGNTGGNIGGNTGGNTEIDPVDPVDDTRTVLNEDFSGTFDARGNESVIEINAEKAIWSVTLIGNAQNNIIIGGKGSDTLDGESGDDVLNGGEGSDTLTGGAGNDTFVYQPGYDAITDYTNNESETDTLRIDGTAVSKIWKSGDRVLVDMSNGGQVKLEGAAGNPVRIEDNHGIYTVSDISSYSNKPTSIITVHSANAEGRFDASDLGFIKVINAAEMEQDVAIVGNDKDNVIYGGQAGSVLTGGQGNDIFVHSLGHDAITDYTNSGEETDIVRITDAAVSDARVNGNDVVLTVTNGSVTLNNAADKAVKIEDARGSYSISNLTSEPKVVLGKEYTGNAFDAGNMGFVQTIDAADTTQAITITGNVRDNVIYAGKGGVSLCGGAGNDRLVVDGKYNDTMAGGVGSDTYVISQKLASDTLLNINQGGYQVGDADTLQFEKINKEDVRYSLQDGVLTIMHSSGGTIAVTDWDTNPLTSIAFANGSVSKADIDDSLAVHSTQPVTQQNIIKSFMKALDDSTMIVESVESALNVAVKFASNYKFSSWSELVNSFIGDIQTYAKMEDGNDSDWIQISNGEGGTEKIVEPGIDRFLKNYCGITLLNDDTGAITGADAGGVTVKTAESIVHESGDLSDVTVAVPGSSTTINGLTFHWKEEVTEQQQNMMNAIKTWWAKEGLDLIEESYGLSFTEEETTVTDISVAFETKDTNTLAYVTSSYNEKTGKANKLKLTVNMKYYNEILDVNGKSDKTSEYLDRTIAHELTHAVMAANITGFSKLPKCITEGTAELVHGVDDERANEILGLANLERSGTRKTTTTITHEDGTQTTTETTLPLSEARKQDLQEAMSLDGDSYYAYAGGYMLLRYFAKQVSDSFNGVTFSNSMLAGSAADALYTFNSGSAATNGALFSVAGNGFPTLPETVDPLVNSSVGVGSAEGLSGKNRKDL